MPLLGGAIAFASFLAYERRAAHPMLKLDLFARRNFAVGNLETLAMYAGLAILFFYLVIFLQQVAGYSALRSGLATLPVTLVMFALSRRFGALAERYGPRLFMGAVPLVDATGLLLLLRSGIETSYFADLLPALLVFSLGLAMTVAPLTATSSPTRTRPTRESRPPSTTRSHVWPGSSASRSSASSSPGSCPPRRSRRTRHR